MVFGECPHGDSSRRDAREIRDGDGSRVWVPLARAFPADLCCPPGRGGFPPGEAIQAITPFPCPAKRQLPPLGTWESPRVGRLVSSRDRVHSSNASSTLGHQIPISWPHRSQDVLSLTEKDQSRDRVGGLSTHSQQGNRCRGAEVSSPGQQTSELILKPCSSLLPHQVRREFLPHPSQCGDTKSPLCITPLRSGAGAPAVRCPRETGNAALCRQPGERTRRLR